MDDGQECRLSVFADGVEFFLLNVWIGLCWEWASQPRRGGRALQEGFFRLRRFARFIS